MGLGWLKPSEFWSLSPLELWWLLEAKQPPKMYGSMTEDQVAQIYEEEYGNPG